MSETASQPPERRLQALRLIVGAMVNALVIYVVVAFVFVTKLQPEAPRDLAPVLTGALGAAAAALLIAAHLFTRARLRSLAASPPRETGAVIDAYAQIVVVAAAMREGVGIIGLLLTILSGQLRWVVVLAAVAAAALLTSLPRRSDITPALGDAPPVAPE